MHSWPPCRCRPACRSRPWRSAAAGPRMRPSSRRRSSGSRAGPSGRDSSASRSSWRRASRGRTSGCRGRSRLSTTTEAAIAALTAGGLVVFPTETVYGLGADALSDAAVERLVAVRGREEGKAILVLVSDLAMVERVATDVPPAARQPARSFWPGPLTLVLPARSGLPAPLGAGTGTIGVRVPGHPLAAALVAGLGRPVTA